MRTTEAGLIAQAGAVAFRQEAVLLFLVARSKQTPENWIFPKGHIEADEDEATAAARELWEETGYEGRVGARLGSIEYARGNARMHVAYFLVEAGRRTGPGDREIQWLPYETARRVLSHADSHALLDEALRLIRHPDA